MEKVLRIGTVCPEWRKLPFDVFVRVTWDGKRLSLIGVEGPKANGDAIGSCGQITIDPEAVTPAIGWTKAKVRKLINVWKRWHLNDMRAGCEHQRAAKWNERKIDSTKPLTHGNMLVWVRPSEHPEGLLCVPCPECGYKYGTAWLHEDVPASVITFLFGLPDADKEPYWV